MRVLLLSLIAAVAALHIGDAEPTLASKFLELAHRQAPGDEAPIDEEGYKEDWTNEHRSEPYPKNSVGKQQHPDFSETVKVQLENAIHMNSWWFWVCILAICAAIGFGLFQIFKK